MEAKWCFIILKTQEWCLQLLNLNLLWTLHSIMLFLYSETQTSLYSPPWIYTILTHVNIIENKPMLNSVADTSPVYLMFYFSVPKVFFWNKGKPGENIRKNCFFSTLHNKWSLLSFSKSSLVAPKAPGSYANL